MRPGTGRIVLKTLLVSSLILVLVVAGGAWLVLRDGVSARDEPGAIEEFVARRLRHLAIPRDEREAKNPASLDDEVLAGARSHFADHCASCHGNDGRGKTTLGQSMYPKAPDMWAPRTQDLSDGEIFYIIKNGVRLTGMAAWGGEGHGDDLESWKLVHLIRHFPRITKEELDEMKALNPRSPAEMRAEIEQERFLSGEDDEPSAPPPAHQH